VDLYIHSPIRLHGVVLNQLRTGTTLLFTFFFTTETFALHAVHFQLRKEVSTQNGTIRLTFFSKINNVKKEIYTQKSSPDRLTVRNTYKHRAGTGTNEIYVQSKTSEDIIHNSKVNNT
jgi:hypothetical protein